jgi:hypothetical protein
MKYSEKVLAETLLAIEKDFDGIPFSEKIPKISIQDQKRLGAAFEVFLRDAKEYIQSLVESGKILPMDFKPENFYVTEISPGQLEADWLRTRNNKADGFTAKKLSKHVLKEFTRLAKKGKPIRISVGTKTYALYGL